MGDLQHPLDASLRERLKASRVNQADFAGKIGRSTGWLNKYMHGAGNATIDDAVRIAALLIGIETAPLSVDERQLLKAYRGIAEESRRDDAVAFLETLARGPRQRQESAEQSAHTPKTEGGKAPGKRKAARG